MNGRPLYVVIMSKGWTDHVQAAVCETQLVKSKSRLEVIVVIDGAPEPPPNRLEWLQDLGIVVVAWNKTKGYSRTLKHLKRQRILDISGSTLTIVPGDGSVGADDLDTLLGFCGPGIVATGNRSNVQIRPLAKRAGSRLLRFTNRTLLPSGLDFHGLTAFPIELLEVVPNWAGHGTQLIMHVAAERSGYERRQFEIQLRRTSLRSLPRLRNVLEVMSASLYVRCRALEVKSHQIGVHS